MISLKFKKQDKKKKNLSNTECAKKVGLYQTTICISEGEKIRTPQVCLTGSVKDSVSPAGAQMCFVLQNFHV